MSAQPAPITTQIKSTGPRTEAGKAASSRNALTHGLASGTLFIEGEDQSEYQSLIANLLEEWQPATPTEHLLVHNMAKHHWLVERAIRLRGEALATAAPGTLPASFAVLLRYQTTNERAFTRAQKSLEEMQQTRREFVSQKAGAVEKQRYKKALASLTAPLPRPDYDKIIERMAAARNAVSQRSAAPAQTAPQP